MAKKEKMWCEKCQKKTVHEPGTAGDKEIYICTRCEKPAVEKDRMLDPTYIDPRERYSLRADRALEEDRIRWGRPF